MSSKQKGFTLHLLQGNRKTSSGYARKGAGFTIIELLVVIVIITIISGVVVVNFRKGERGNKLQRSAQQVVQSIRKAQNMALSSVEVRDNIYYYYGVYFNINTPNYFYIFAGENKVYNPDDKVGPAVELEDGVIIDSVKPNLNGKLNITFVPPYSFVEFNPTTDEATITIKKQGGVCPQDCRYIKINNTGWMSISKTP